MVRKISVDYALKDLYGKFYCPECLTSIAHGSSQPTWFQHRKPWSSPCTTNAARSTGVSTQAYVLYLMEWEKPAEDHQVENLKLALLNIEETNKFLMYGSA